MNLNFDPNFGIRLQIPQPKNFTYGVTIKYDDLNGKGPKHRVDYQMVIQINSLPNTSDYLIQFDKKELFLNRKKPDLLMEKLNELVLLAIYPNQHIINNLGGIKSSFTNHRQILQRWEVQKEKIRSKYQSETTEEFFKANEKVITNRNRLEDSFENDMFWNLYFHPKHLEYTAKLKQPLTLKFPMVPYRLPIRFSGMQKISEIISDYDSILIEFESDEEFMGSNSYLNPENLPNVRLAAKVDFDLFSTHKFPMHIRANFMAYQKLGNEKKILKNIDLSMYHLNVQQTKNLKKVFLEPGLPSNSNSNNTEKSMWQLFKDKLNGKF